MTTNGRQAACVVMLMFIAGGALLSATRLAAAPPEPDDPKLAGHFSGQVTGPDGKPLSRARVFIVPTNGAIAEAEPVRAETGTDGRFEFDAPDMTLTDLDGLPTRRPCLLIATADGYGPDWVGIRGRIRSGNTREAASGTDLALQLAADDVPIHGRFIDPDGRPLAGARVRITAFMIPQGRDLDAHLEREKASSGFYCGPYARELYRPDLLPGLATETRTDADGRFTLTGLGRERRATLTVSAPSVVDTSLTVITRDAPDVRVGLGDELQLAPELPPAMIYGAGLTLKLEKGRTISGVVRDRDTREPIAGMWVGPLHHPLGGVSSSLYPRVTDEKGRFTITGLDPRTSKRKILAVAAPGLPYQSAGVEVEGDSEALIECPRGISFRLKLVDEQGTPVAAEVTYAVVHPNRSVLRLIPDDYLREWPNAPAARRADGIYEGFALPGPGAVLVKTPDRLDYRPAHVDPKAFFARGRTDWTAQERISAYGTEDNLVIVDGLSGSQSDYAAIVLLNPPTDSGPLELSATVVRDRPRRVSLIDPDGKPVVAVKARGLTRPRGYEPPLRSATFFLPGLHPDYVKRVTFIKDDRQLIGFLLARGDGDAPYTVRMQPWGTVNGRIVDENGKALSDAPPVIAIDSNPDVGLHGELNTDAEGRFRIEQLIPDVRYNAKVYRGPGTFAGLAFEDLVLSPGEVRDLGDIRTKPPIDVRGK
jgi:hypothetical protein